MDVDCLPSQPSIESSQEQVMDEELERIDLRGLDIFELEQAFQRKEFDKIQEHQLDKLEVIISRAFRLKELGIQPGSRWDGNQLPKDSMKRGRKIDLERTITVGKILVDSGRYAKLIKYYKPLPNSES